MANAFQEIRTHKDVVKLGDMYEKVKAKLSSVKEKAEIAAGRAIHASETVGTAFGFGWARGRYADEKGEWEMMGLPPDLTVGVLGLGFSFLGLTGKYDDHVAAIGTGAASAFATVKGIEMGAASASSKAPGHRYNAPGGPRPTTAGTRQVGEGAAGRAWAPGQRRETVNAP
jgi:hypothetical protein